MEPRLKAEWNGYWQISKQVTDHLVRQLSPVDTAHTPTHAHTHTHTHTRQIDRSTWPLQWSAKCLYFR